MPHLRRPGTSRLPNAARMSGSLLRAPVRSPLRDGPSTGTRWDAVRGGGPGSPRHLDGGARPAGRRIPTRPRPSAGRRRGAGRRFWYGLLDTKVMGTASCSGRSGRTRAEVNPAQWSLLCPTSATQTRSGFKVIANLIPEAPAAMLSHDAGQGRDDRRVSAGRRDRRPVVRRLLSQEQSTADCRSKGELTRPRRT